MAQIPELIVGFVPAGMNSALDPALLDNTQYEYGVNLWLDRQLPRQRPGARVLQLVGEPEEIEALRSLNIQGAIVHNPARGQGTQIFGENSARIIVSAGGRKFSLNPTQSGAYSSLEVLEITNEAGQAADVHLVWLENAESYVISGDGVGSTWIFDGITARYTIGFQDQDPDQGPDDPPTASEIPAGLRAPLYAHGRLWVVVSGREVLAGDIIHGANQTEAVDLINFTETGYFAEGQHFAPPTNMGDIIASAVLPIAGDITGQGDLLWHCADSGGVFSIKGNVHPRTSWSDTPMVNAVLLDTSATGPYALDSHDQDQIFRSRYGIETLRSARGESNEVGKPIRTISEEAGRWLDKDHTPFLRFASLVIWRTQERVLCTTQPVIEEAHRYHRGIVVCNLDTVDSRRTVRAWESMWTFPPEIAGVVQLVKGLFGDQERLFGIHRGTDGVNRFVEYEVDLPGDVMEDGRGRSIECQLCTRARIEPGNHLLQRTISTGQLLFSEVTGAVKYEVFHSADRGCWELWQSGERVVNDQCPTLICEDQNPENCCPPVGAPSLGFAPGDIFQPLSTFTRTARRHQWLIRWSGEAKLEGLLVYFEELHVAQQTDLPDTGPTNQPYCCTTVEDFSYGRA